MTNPEYISKASSYLNALCGVEPNRRTGSPGNQEAADFFANLVKKFDYRVDTTPFPCLDYISGNASLESAGISYDIAVSPYSLRCDVTAELVSVTTVDELENCDCQGRILLMQGAICAEQLMPKNFVFYNPEHHQRIYALLEEKQPAGIVTATEKNPDLVGALYPYPLLVDGDFNIPNVYCTAQVGQDISRKSGDLFRLMIDSERLPSQANNVVARKNLEADQKIVLTAHIDAYENTPGASDNASGTVVLLLLAEMFMDFRGEMGIEIVAINGEDHYSAGGEMDYLDRYGEDLGRIRLAINIDDVGFKVGGSAYSFYGCPPNIQNKARLAFEEFPGVVPGEPWFNGDHMIFVQNNVPAIAFTAENVLDLMATITHTSRDTPEILDPAKLVEVARALKSFILQF
jgi:aminopeptidase YwaD